jgi:hypothetical protein
MKYYHDMIRILLNNRDEMCKISLRLCKQFGEKSVMIKDNYIHVMYSKDQYDEYQQFLIDNFVIDSLLFITSIGDSRWFRIELMKSVGKKASKVFNESI